MLCVTGLECQKGSVIQTEGVSRALILGAREGWGLELNPDSHLCPRTARQGPGPVQREAPPVCNWVCGLRRWCFHRVEARPSPFPSVAGPAVAAVQAPTGRPHLSHTRPSCCSVVTWTQFPSSCLLPSLGSTTGLTALPISKIFSPRKPFLSPPQPPLGSPLPPLRVPQSAPLTPHTENHLDRQSIFHLVPG